MHVGVILDKFPGVSETFLIHHVNGLIEAGHEVTVFARNTPPHLNFHPSASKHDLKGRTRFLPYQERGSEQIRMIPRTLRSIRSGWKAAFSCLDPVRHGAGVFRLRAFHGLPVVEACQFDLLHCHYAAVGWSFLPYREVFNVPLVTSFHGDHPGSFGRGREWLLQGLFRRGDAFIANSRFTRGELLRLGCRPAKIHTIPAIAEDAPVRLRGESMDSDVFHVVSVARLDVAKGIQTALRSIHELIRQGTQVRYTIAGDGPYSRDLRSLVEELRISDHVRFLGWLAQDEVSALYREADVVVLPSIGSEGGMSEAQGLVLQEAQLHGVPVIGSDIGGIPESLDFGRAGLLFQRGDPLDLARTLRRTLSEPKLVAELTRHAQTYVRGKYLASAVIPRLVRLYEFLLQGREVTERPS